MNRGVKQAGFTVIEVMLFLAVSAGLSAAIFGASILNINQQRYIDAVNSTKALFQEQYVNTIRVQNPNEEDAQCPSGPTNVTTGANDCLVVGKLVSVTGGTSIIIRNIVGVPADEDYFGAGVTDITALQKMTSLFAVNIGSESLSPQWSTAWKAKLSTNPGVNTFSIAILRSPTTGTSYSFYLSGPGRDFIPADDSSIGEDIRADVLGGPAGAPTNLLSGDLTVCVDPQGLTNLAQEIVIHGKISSASGVEQRDSSGC